MIAGLVRTLHRKYLEMEIAGWKRDLASIDAHRRNDSAVEKVIRAELTIAEARLRKLTADEVRTA